ncbi:DBH-like monooxygenase protein 1 [Bulinus truncatus]|nr:DBH-like monooxygenase protein 1 [Bulinus truncatus]
MPSTLGALNTQCPQHSVPSTHGALNTRCPQHSGFSTHEVLNTRCPQHSVPSTLGALNTRCPQHSMPSTLVALNTRCPQHSGLSTHEVLNTRCPQHSMPSTLGALNTPCPQHSRLSTHEVLNTRCPQHSLPSTLAALNTRCPQHSLPSTLVAVNTRCPQHSVLSTLEGSSGYGNYSLSDDVIVLDFRTSEYEPVIQAGNEGLVHHANLFYCRLLGDPSEELNKDVNCNTLPQDNCEMFVTWSAGGKSRNSIKLCPEVSPETLLNCVLRGQSRDSIKLCPEVSLETLLNCAQRGQSRDSIKLCPEVSPETLLNCVQRGQSRDSIKLCPEVSPETLLNCVQRVCGSCRPHGDSGLHAGGIVDSSGLRLYLTPNVRKYDAASLGIGANNDEYLIVPPLAQNFVYRGHCDASCTNRVRCLENNDIHIFAVYLHGHAYCRGIRIRHFQNGVELPPIVDDKNYHFRNQSMRLLGEERTVQKGQSLVVECNYDTREATKLLYGGHMAVGENCVSFVLYYPKINWPGCSSSVDYQIDGRPVKSGIFKIVQTMNWTIPKVRTDFQRVVSTSPIASLCVYNNQVCAF